MPSLLDRLRAELADLAYDLERQGRLDAADVVMQLDARVRELAGCEDVMVVAGLAEAGSADDRAGTATPATAD